MNAGSQFEEDICTPMYVAALFAIAKKIWKQHKCPSIDEWIKKMYIYTMEYYSAIRRTQIVPFTTTWMELEGIMLNEIRQAEKEILYDFAYLWSLKTKQNEQNSSILTDTEK